MDKKEYNKEQLDFIFGDLSKEEEEKYKEELKKNPDKAGDVEFLKKIIAREKLNRQIEAIENDPGYAWAEAEAEKAVKEHNRRKRLQNIFSHHFLQNYLIPMAAAIFFLVVMRNVITLSVSPETAFQRFYKDYSPANYTENTIEQAQVVFASSMSEYDNGNYDAVTENMRTLMERGELNTMGVIVLATHDAWNGTYKGEKLFENSDQEDALWYLAVTALKLDNYKAAQALLSEIAANFDGSAKKAERMERRINKMLSVE